MLFCVTTPRTTCSTKIMKLCSRGRMGLLREAGGWSSSTSSAASRWRTVPGAPVVVPNRDYRSRSLPSYPLSSFAAQATPTNAGRWQRLTFLCGFSCRKSFQNKPTKFFDCLQISFFPDVNRGRNLHLDQIVLKCLKLGKDTKKRNHLRIFTPIRVF